MTRTGPMLAAILAGVFAVTLEGCQWVAPEPSDGGPIQVHENLVFQPETACPTESVHAETGKWFWLFPSDNFPDYVRLLSDAADGRSVVHAVGRVTPDRPFQLLKLATGLAAGLIFDAAFVRNWRDGILPALYFSAFLPVLLPTHLTISVDADVVAASGGSASAIAAPAGASSAGGGRPRARPASVN